MPQMARGGEAGVGGIWRVGVNRTRADTWQLPGGGRGQPCGNGAGGGGTGDVPGRSAPRRRSPAAATAAFCCSSRVCLWPGAASHGLRAPRPARGWQRGQRAPIPGWRRASRPSERSLLDNAAAPVRSLTCSLQATAVVLCICMCAHTRFLIRCFYRGNVPALILFLCGPNTSSCCQHWMLSLHVQGFTRSS